MNIKELEFKVAGCCGEYQVAKIETPDGTLQITKAGDDFRVVLLNGTRMVRDLGVITAADLEGLA